MTLSYAARMCYGKKAWQTEDRAKKCAAVIAEREGVKLRVYACPMCGQWHTSSKPVKILSEIDPIPPKADPPVLGESSEKEPRQTHPKCHATGKRQYDSISDARYDSPNIIPFLCKSCGKYHITTSRR